LALLAQFEEGDAAAQPMHLLLERGSDVWPQLLEMLVREGGFCHEEDRTTTDGHM